MNIKNGLITLAATAFCANLCASDSELCGTSGNWELDAGASSLSFITVKKDTVSETHSFKTLSGTANAQSAQLTIDLSSVDTGIDIRNQRMLEHLFEVVKYPSATASVDTQNKSLAALSGAGKTLHQPLPLTLSLHGIEQTLEADLSLSCSSDKALLVETLKPVVIQAENFKLDGGVEKLRELAGLSSISPKVEVQLSLAYTRK